MGRDHCCRHRLQSTLVPADRYQAGRILDQMEGCHQHQVSTSACNIQVYQADLRRRLLEEVWRAQPARLRLLRAAVRPCVNGQDRLSRPRYRLSAVQSQGRADCVRQRAGRLTATPGVWHPGEPAASADRAAVHGLDIRKPGRRRLRMPRPLFTACRHRRRRGIDHRVQVLAPTG